jgi:transcriptional regulator with XRE-family HTH domain
MSRLRTVVGATLRRRRQAQARTLREVADAAGVSLTYLSEVERGRKEPSSEVLEAVCAALGLVLADLLFEVAEELVRLEMRGSLPAIGFIPQRPGTLPAPELPDRAVRAVRAVRARPASALARPPLEQLEPVVGSPGDHSPVARVIDLYAFASRRSA